MNFINKKFYDLKNFKEIFDKNLPFPHIVIDNFLSQEFYENLNLDKKNINEKNGKQFETDFEKNKWIKKNKKLPNKIKMIINELNSELWTKKLSELSNIESVFATKIGNIDFSAIKWPPELKVTIENVKEKNASDEDSDNKSLDK